MALMTVDELAQMTGRTFSDPAEKAMLETMIDAASGIIEQQLGRKLALGDYVQRHFHLGDTALLEAYPVETVTAVRLDDGELTQWQLDDQAGILRFPRRLCGRLEVQYRGGFTEIPTAILQACALIVLSLRQSMANEGQVLMSERLGDYQMMYYQQQTASGSATISPAATALLLPWKNRRVAG